MAKFCKFCGSALEEGQICTCPNAQAAAQAAPEAVPAAPAPEAASVATAAPAAAPAAGNAFLTKLKDTLLGYWKAPKAAAAAAAEDKQGMAIAGIFAGVNFLAVFFFLWRMLGQFTVMLGDILEDVLSSLFGGLGGMFGVSVEDALEFEYPILPLLLSSIVIVAVGIAVTALVVFVAAKLSKQETDIKKLMIIQSVHTVIPSALLLVGLVLGFITWELQILVLALVLVLWFINVCNDVRDTAGIQAMNSSKTLLLQSVIMFVALAIIVFAIYTLSGWCLGELTINDTTLTEISETIDINFEDIVSSLMGDAFGDMLGDMF